MRKSSSTAKTTWGGARAGAGRKKTSPFVSHLERPSLSKKLPMKVLLRLRSGFESLRTDEMFEVFKKGAHRARRFGIRIIEYSLLDSSVHMLCEAKSKEELEKSFKSLNTTLAIALKKNFKARTGKSHAGPVFLGRYHLTMLESPEEVKGALREVLLKPTEHFRKPLFEDLYSSGVIFEKWRRLLTAAEYEEKSAHAETVDEEIKRVATTITASPQFWLTKSGWMKA